MRGKLIVVDGVDSSGKGLQTDLLLEALINTNIPAKKLSFPMYDSDSSALVKMYLSGEMGKNAGDVNAYAASLFFAVDRYATYKTRWGGLLGSGISIVADRYSTSNAIHQAVKLGKEERDAFLDWLDDLEYHKLALPRPDLVIYLDMPVQTAVFLMEKRYMGDESKKDIHEQDIEYLKKCHEAADYACEKLGWTRVKCVENGILLPKEEIHNRIMAYINPLFSELRGI